MSIFGMFRYKTWRRDAGVCTGNKVIPDRSHHETTRFGVNPMQKEPTRIAPRVYREIRPVKSTGHIFK